MRELTTEELNRVGDAIAGGETSFGGQMTGTEPSSQTHSQSWAIYGGPNGVLLNSGTHSWTTSGTPTSTTIANDSNPEFHDHSTDCPNQMTVSGVELDKSFGAAQGTFGVGVESGGAGADGDIWLFGSVGAGFDLRDISGLDIARGVASIGGVGVSGFTTTMNTDESGGDFQVSASGDLFGAGFSTDFTDCNTTAGAAIGSAQFSAGVSGDFALNLTDMAQELGTSVNELLNNWEAAVSQLSSEDVANDFRDIFTPPGTGGYEDFFRDERYDRYDQ